MDFARCSVIFFAQRSFAFREYVLNDPHAMTDVVESYEAAIEHHHAIIEAEFVGAAGWNLFNQANHVVGEIANRASDQWRQAWDTNGAIARGEFAQKLDGIFVEALGMSARFDCAIRSARMKNFFGVGSGKCVARDGLAALDAFKEKRIFRFVRDAQVRTDWGQQVGGKRVAYRHEIAFACEAHERFEIRLNHR